MTDNSIALGDIARRRLRSQRMGLEGFADASEAVGWLTAVQAQDFAGAKWAVALRLRRATDAGIERAFNEGVILRTHVLRPTWHFVRPADIRWLLALTAPHVHAANAHMYRRLEVDGAAIRRSRAALSKALRDGEPRTRLELGQHLERAGLAVQDSVRLAYLLMHSELDGLICSGPRRGKSFTYALLDQRAPAARPLDRSEALAELARRYFVSRGPATVRDFAKWSGLPMGAARDGLDLARKHLAQDVVEGLTYWFAPSSPPPRRTPSPKAHLLSIYDEYLSSYADHRSVRDDRTAARLRSMGPALQWVLLVDGRIVGTWKRAIRRDGVHIQRSLWRRLTPAERHAVSQVERKFTRFLGLLAV